MIPALTYVFGCATKQHHPIPTGTEISDNLAYTRWLRNTPWGINRTLRNAISDNSKFRQHCQDGFWEETSLCEVRALNKVLHTNQDTTHFLLFDGDTIQAHSELLTMRWRPTDHNRCQLEHLKQQKLISRTWQHIVVEATTQFDSIRTLYRCRWARKPTCAEQNDRTLPTLAAAVPAQRTGTQLGTPQFRSPWSDPSPVAHPRAS